MEVVCDILQHLLFTKEMIIHKEQLKAIVKIQMFFHSSHWLMM